MYYESCKTEHGELINAWHIFINTGIIPEGVLRPDIYTSWMRCRKQRVYDPAVETLSPDELLMKRQNNAILIACAQPVMEDIDTVLDKILGHNYAIILLDVEGDIIEMINKGSDFFALGNRCSEAKSGPNAIGIALKEKKVAEVYGYEHLYPGATEWHTIATPIFNFDNSLAGGLGVINQTARVPSIVPLVKIGARVCESSYILEQINKQRTSFLLKDLKEPVIVTNDQGVILSVNQQVSDLLNIPFEQIIGQILTNYLTGNIDPDILSTAPNGLSVFRNVAIKGKKTYNSIMIKKSIVGYFDNRPLMTFVFKNTSTGRLKIIRPTRNDNHQLYSFDDLIGESASFTAVKTLARKAAHISSNVLIEGESGTGKELIAQSIHSANRPNGPFIAVNCGSITKELLQSELFGYEEGAFTGAKRGGKPGKFLLADKGTLFLDEVGEMPKDMQVSLLRVLQEGIVTRVGGTKPEKVDVRIIAATNRNLYKEVQNGNFRDDLYYRLNVIEIKMPSLRERAEDIPLLATKILNLICLKLNLRKDMQISEEVMDKLCSYNWPGNIRELQNILERAAICADNKVITCDCLPPLFGTITKADIEDEDGVILKDYEKLVLLKAVRKHRGNISKSATELGIARSTLYRKMKKYEIDPDELD